MMACPGAIWRVGPAAIAGGLAGSPAAEPGNAPGGWGKRFLPLGVQGELLPGLLCRAALERWAVCVGAAAGRAVGWLSGRVGLP